MLSKICLITSKCRIFSKRVVKTFALPFVPKKWNLGIFAEVMNFDPRSRLQIGTNVNSKF